MTVTVAVTVMRVRMMVVRMMVVMVHTLVPEDHRLPLLGRELVALQPLVLP
jgi:hypothetical protein